MATGLSTAATQLLRIQDGTCGNTSVHRKCVTAVLKEETEDCKTII